MLDPGQHFTQVVAGTAVVVTGGAVDGHAVADRLVLARRRAGERFEFVEEAGSDFRRDLRRTAHPPARVRLGRTRDVDIVLDAVVPEHELRRDLARDGERDLAGALACCRRLEFGNAFLEVGAAVATEICGVRGAHAHDQCSYGGHRNATECRHRSPIHVSSAPLFSASSAEAECAARRLAVHVSSGPHARASSARRHEETRVKGRSTDWGTRSAAGPKSAGLASCAATRRAWNTSIRPDHLRETSTGGLS